MRSTIAHRKLRYQPPLWDLDSVGMMRPMSPVHGPSERLPWNRVVARLGGAEPFEIVTRPTALQREAFKLLGVRLERTQ